MGAEWIEYKGEKIMLSDLSCSEEEGQLKTLEKGYEILKNEPEGSVLILLDTTNTETTVKVNFKLNNDKPVIKAKAKAIAVVGARGIQHWIASVFMSGIECFDTREEAMKWLVEKKSLTK